MKSNKKSGDKNKKDKLSTGEKVAIGAGIAAVGAGAYYFLGPDGKKHRRKAKELIAKTADAAEDRIGKEMKNLKNQAKPALQQGEKSVKKAAGEIKEITQAKITKKKS